jgi:hypothetical protein
MTMWKPLAVAALALLAQPAWAEEWDFVLTNATGKTIKQLEVSPGGAGTWVVDGGGGETPRERLVKTGGRTTVHFDKGEGCRYDLRATFEDGATQVWNGIDVCKNSYVTVRANAFTAS